MKVLVAGGAGYIGSHAVKKLIENGHSVIVVDNLYRGHRAAVHPEAAFVQADLLETEKLSEAMKAHQVDTVIHFAALTYVGESVDEPLSYYTNNVSGTVSILEAMSQAGVKKIVFSSTAATYGEPIEMPITEDTPQAPINPYGRSKLMMEKVIEDFAATDPDFSFAALRYFNVAGCASDGSLGEDHDPETHLVPVILQAASGKREFITIFGVDYPTPDGTCIRDYVHVEDLAEAHLLVAEKMQLGEARRYNLGIGRGYSVKEIIDATKRATGIDFEVRIGERRPGDPPQLYASPAKIESELGWKAKHTDIEEIILTAWNWFKNNPNGYND